VTTLYFRAFKRGADILGAACAFILLSPILLAIATAIRLEDRQPALFRQARVGRGGAEFTIFKFRSMPVATPNVPSAAATRLTVTRVGRFIRRTNLDELPQLLNILSGDMSFIGPRPALHAQAALIDLRRQQGVLAIRPGLTGLAQVNAYDGMPESEKVDWERRYLERITFLGDLRILLQTIVYLLRPPPVY
jgi:O-antigen biosynthesis protein WbqP